MPEVDELYVGTSVHTRTHTICRLRNVFYPWSWSLFEDGHHRDDESVDESNDGDEKIIKKIYNMFFQLYAHKDLRNCTIKLCCGKKKTF